jgi:hypothetical protein
MKSLVTLGLATAFVVSASSAHAGLVLRRKRMNHAISVLRA